MTEPCTKRKIWLSVYNPNTPKFYDWPKSTSGFTHSLKLNNSKLKIGKQHVREDIESFECHKASHPLNFFPQKTLLLEDGLEIEGEHILEVECSENENDDQLIFPSE